MSTLPPGPALPPSIQTFRWLMRPIAFLESCRRRFGDTFSVRFVGFEAPTVVVSSPDAIRRLYGEREHGLPRGRAVSLRPLMGPSSVVLLEGEEHLSRRRLMSPQFHGDRMRAYEATVQEVAEKDIDGWPKDRPFALHPHMQLVTLDVMLRVVFGVIDPQRRALLRELLIRMLVRPPASPLKQYAVTLAHRNRTDDPVRVRTARTAIDRVLHAEIAERRGSAASADRHDILSLLVLARFPDGEPMSDEEICDQLVTILIAGHETTATAISWTVDLLAHHPTALARLESELLDGRDAYLRAVISEALRLRPVIPLIGRRLTSELRVDGHALPPGTDVTVALSLTHTRSDLYEQPYAFRPERFLEHSPPVYSWLPFGGGVRRCLGAAFAEMEARTVLATMVRRRVLRAASSRSERVVRRNVTFSPRRGTRIRASRRPA